MNNLSMLIDKIIKLQWAKTLLFYLLFLNITGNFSNAQVNPQGIPFPRLDSPIETKDTIAAAQSSQNALTTKKVDTAMKSADIPYLLGKHKDAIAKWYNIPKEKFDKMCQNDKCVKIDQDGRLFHACAGLALSPEEAQRLISQESPKSSLTFNYDIETNMAFELESMPNAKRTIYLDFNGHITRGTFWNNTDRPEIIHPAMDLVTPGVGLTPDYFTEHELQAIIRIWKQVCEDFSPYEVNVTTKEPPLDKLIKFNNTDQEYGIRVVIGGTGRNFLNASYGGIAYVGSFSWANDTPTFAFSDNLGRVPKYIAEVISHEVGHTAGLWHHGRTDGATYHTGDGLWAPIMGSTYAARVGQWSKGEYPLANNKNPDMETMAKYMPFKEDIEAHPAHNPILGQPLYGTIHKPNEIDSFFLDLKGGTITVRVELPEYFANTDLCMNLKDRDGNILHTYKFYPTPFVTVNVKKGDYILELFGATFVGAGNSAYGSTGEYKLTVTQDTEIPEITNVTITEETLSGENYLKISNIETSFTHNDMVFSYQWQVASYNSPSSFKDIEGATRNKLNIHGQEFLGKYLKVIVTPHVDQITNKEFVVTPFRVTAPAPQEVIAKEPIEFVSSLNITKNTQMEEDLMINELSQGHNYGNNPEWIELLTLKETNLRGLSIKTKDEGILKFRDLPTWEKIPEGTLILIYNGNEKDPLVEKDKFLPNTERVIIASSEDKSLFEGSWAKLKSPQNKLTVTTGFENNEKKSYAEGPINIDNINWVLSDTLIGEDPRDMKEGNKSLRIRNGGIQTQDFLKDGISKISFLYSRANFSGDRTGTSPAFQVFYSTEDDPSTWIPISTEIAVYNDVLMEFNAVINYDGEYKIKIVKVSGTKDKRWNIDSLKVTASNTMNFVKFVNSHNQILDELTFGYSQKAIKNGFLLPGNTEAFIDSNTKNLKNGENWNQNFWSKNNLSITPGKANSTENLELFLNLSSQDAGLLAQYSLVNPPESLSIDPHTGRVHGTINKGGYYELKIALSIPNSINNGNFEIIPILVRQSFADTFSDNPEIANNPQGDHNNNGIPNIVEFALGDNAKTETSVLTLSELNSMIGNIQKQNTLKQNTLDQNTLNQGEQLALSITYTKNKTALGIDTLPQWSSDLKNWNTDQIQSAVIEDLGDKETIISWIPITSINNKMFMRVLVKEN